MQNFSIHDGPGIRTTIFFKGCPLACQWCANPDTQRRGPELVHDRSKCTGCLTCVQICPESCIRVPDLNSEEKFPIIDRKAATLCRECIAACPSGALGLVGWDISLAEVLEEIEGEKHFFRNSGGGITLSGGEPTAQPEFAKAILKACRRWAIDTAMETCGHCEYEVLETLAGLCSTLYMDLKHMDNNTHKRLTRVGNKKILDNLIRISRSHPGLIVRIPVIPGLNDDVANLSAMGEFLTGQTGVTRVEFLNYHNLGKHKYVNLGRTYDLEDLRPLGDQVFVGLCKEFAGRFPGLSLSYHN